MDNQKLKHSSKYYLYRVNYDWVKLQNTFSSAKRVVQTLADITGKNIFLYFVNYDDEIYFVREIKSCQTIKSVKK